MESKQHIRHEDHDSIITFIHGIASNIVVVVSA